MISLNVLGGWDVSSFCDPKLNTPGEKVINRWANRVTEVPGAAKIPYAPVWGNEAFFIKYARDMLVINGVDAQTNSHSTGQIHAFSGRLSQGYPTFTSLVGAVHGSGMALPYVNFGGYAGTGGLVIAAQNLSPQSIADDLSRYDESAHRQVWGVDRILPEKSQQLLNRKRRQRLQRLMDEPNLTPKRRKALDEMLHGLNKLPELKRFHEFLPEELVPNEDELGFHPIYQEAQVAMVAYQAGLTTAVDLMANGNFDTHANHDHDHEKLIRIMTREIDFIWELAGEMGLAEHITLVINSEFSRTPFYNGEQGKDHWPIGSVVIMKKGVDWTNRVVGATDEMQNAMPINPNTLQVDRANGRLIYPKDIHAALRRLTGVADDPRVRRFGLGTEVEFDFFNPNKQTPQLYSR